MCQSHTVITLYNTDELVTVTSTDRGWLQRQTVRGKTLVVERVHPQVHVQNTKCEYSVLKRVTNFTVVDVLTKTGKKFESAHKLVCAPITARCFGGIALVFYKLYKCVIPLSARGRGAVFLKTAILPSVAQVGNFLIG
jgi:hypothetical protein